jgi:hypothetical protein
MISLRQRLRKDGINCLPWKYWRGEIKSLPISSQTLFMRRGLPIDVLEEELKSEGWLFEHESLIEVISSEHNLRRKHIGADLQVGDEEAEFDETWTEEDYRAFYADLKVAV